jgi:hypothetical protein
MSTITENITETQRDTDMVAWAKAGDFNPRTRLTAAEAADSNRAMLEAAGVDVESLERSVGRPRINPRDATVSITFRAPTNLDHAAKTLAKKQGRERSDLIRDALTEYVAAHERELVAA